MSILNYDRRYKLRLHPPCSIAVLDRTALRNHGAYRRSTRARKLARHDPRPVCFNRRFFKEKLEEYLGAAGATHQVAVLMLGIDGLRRSTTYGHAAGPKRRANLPAGSRRSCAGVHFWSEWEASNSRISNRKLRPSDDPTNLAAHRGGDREAFRHRTRRGAKSRMR